MYLLHNFFYDDNNFEQQYARRKFYKVIIIYDSIEEKKLFEEYIYTNKEPFIKRVSEKEKEFDHIEFDNKLEEKDVRRKLSVGTVLNEMLKEYRKQIN